MRKGYHQRCRQSVESLAENAPLKLPTEAILEPLPDEDSCAATLEISNRGRTDLPSQMIGRYKLLQEIGEGGLGVVYLAHQTEPVKRRVAIQVIKPGMDSREIVARFEAERQALMDHPNIAQVFDGGSMILATFPANLSNMPTTCGVIVVAEGRFELPTKGL